MKRTAIALSVSLAAGLPVAALAQAGHGTHRPPAAAAPLALPAPPEQCRSMMDDMPPACREAMQQMMQAGGMQDAMSAAAPAGTAGTRPVSRRLT